MSFSWSSDGTRLTVKTDTLQFTTDYVLTIAGSARSVHGFLLDGNGDGVGGDNLVITFRTSRADITAPKIVKMYPKQGATNVELHPIISAWYDEELDSTVDMAALFKLERFLDHTYVPGVLKHYVVNRQSVLTFFPNAPLNPRETYVTRIFAGLRDYFGNVVVNNRSYSFVTAEVSPTTVRIDDFEAGVGNWWAPQQSGSTTGIVTERTGRQEERTLVDLLTGSTTSMRVDYAWDLAAPAWLIRTYLSGGAPKNVRFDGSWMLQVYVFGDGSGTLFRFCVDDRVPDYQAANHEVSPWYVVDWVGWRLVTWDMSRDGTGTWLGDGVLNGTLGFDSIQLSYEPGGAAQGSLIFDDLRVARPIGVSVQQPLPPVLSSRRVLEGYPNPFNAVVTLQYEVPDLLQLQRVRVVMYDALGRKVKTIVDAPQAPGTYTVQWDGTDERGQNVASGVYLCRLSTEKGAAATQVILAR